MKRMVMRFLIIVFLFFSLAGCLNLKKGFPEKHYYILDVSHNGRPTNLLPGPALSIRKLRVSPRFEGKGMVYRRGSLTYESDYYNEFLIHPGSILTEELRQWLARSGLFQYVTDGSGHLQPTHILEGTVSALYGDFRNGAVPKAVLEMEFFLVRDLSARNEIIFRKDYAEAIPLKESSSESLAQGWNDALRRILTALEEDLRKVDFKKRP